MLIYRGLNDEILVVLKSAHGRLWFNLCTLHVSPDKCTVPCGGKSKGRQRLNILLLTHYIMRPHFFFIYARAHACSPAEPRWAACVRHVLCVVTTEFAEVDATPLSGIVLILLTDY